MALPMNVVWDVGLGLILISILWSSWKRGFLVSLIRLVGTAAGFALASFLKGPVARWAYDSFLQHRVENYVADALAAQGDVVTAALQNLDRAGALAAQMLSATLAEYGLDFFAGQDAAQMGSEILGRISQNGLDPAAAIAQVAVRPLVMTVLETAVFFLLLFLVDIVVRTVARIGLGVNRIPLLGTLNRFAGLLCGAVYALLVGYVAASALLLLAGLGKNQWTFLNSSVLQKTLLVNWFLGLRSYFP